ncbi:hypothetical protein D7Y24_15065 [Stenotrophomonas maltophilia]|nr:hypothetical protein [Stenotrophomonas maltophilia]QBL39169.1 hypothetical protein MG068_01015 [Stenotrophomonas sp. ASS1]
MRTACSARSRSCRGGRVGSAGLRPAPAVVPAAGRQPQKQQLAFHGLAGRVRTTDLVGANLGWHNLAVREVHPRVAWLY